MRHDSFDERRRKATGTSVWRLGDVLEELLEHYGLTDACSPAIGAQAARSDAGLFSTSDLPAAAVATY